MTIKYLPLKEYLQSLPAVRMEVTLSFEQVECILGQKLPQKSAHHRQEWWENDYADKPHSQAQAWISAGWKKDQANLKEKWVCFVRA